MPLSLEQIRKTILIALVSDDELLDTLVLKGGNALALVHDVGNRASADLDFSIATNFPDEKRAQDRMFALLDRQFGEVGYEVFDKRFLPKPSVCGPNQPAWWGGYIVEFKLVERALYDKHKDDLDSLRRNAAITGPQGKKVYTIDISKNEYCAAKVQREIEGFGIYVYSLEMIALEKLRAICQQMPDYKITRHAKSARARDFYDIYEVATRDDVDLRSIENRAMLVEIFAAKEVAIELLGKIVEFEDFHAPDWPGVVATVGTPLAPFKFYFDFVVQLADELRPSG
jgi:predicted nucleotidyltransferase component of viral defense system